MSRNYKQIKLYFDANQVCLGGVANDWWQRDYNGDYWASEYFWLPVGYDPIGKSVTELLAFQHQPSNFDEGALFVAKVIIERPDNLMTALFQVRNQGTCNMLDLPCVLSTLHRMGYETVAIWLQNYKAIYSEILIDEFSEWLTTHPTTEYESLAQQVARETGLEVIVE